MKVSNPLCIGVLLLVYTQSSFANEDDFIGIWPLSIKQGMGQSHGVLTVERNDTGFVAFVNGGPVPMKINGNRISLEVDWRDDFDTKYISFLSGELKNDKLKGRMEPEKGAASSMGVPLESGTWSARRFVENEATKVAEPLPVDLSGFWMGNFSNREIKKVSFDMTEEGQYVVDNYRDMDDPALRCASYGVMRATRFPFPQEIVQTEKQLLLIIGGDYIRRIYLDGRTLPENLEPSSLGYSVGHWEGSKLVVETTGLTENFVSAHLPYSSDTRLVEHYYTTGDGKLILEMWLHDAKYYNRPLYSLSIRVKAEDQVIGVTGCDPYAFFRSLAIHDELDELWERGKFRR